MTRTILVTGASSGLGRAIAEVALAAGHRVIGTVRNDEAAKAFEALKPGQAYARRLDVTETASIAPAIAAMEAEIGPIDVLVNNAGYGHEGTIEETPLDEFRHQMEVNVFGAFAVLQAILPYMRKRRAGHIFNITSMGGFITMPGLGVYHASKFALEAISETLGKEVKDLGIRVTAVEPGSFRTDWAGRSMVRVPRSIPDYDAVFEPLRARRQGYSGKQAGDPARLGAAILQLMEAPNPPAHLLLGNDAVTLVREKLSLLDREFTEWERLSRSTDFA